MNYELLFLKALFVTITAESVAIVMMVRFVSGIRYFQLPWLQIVGACVIPSCTTLPYLWFVLPMCISNYYLRIISGEVAIVLIEMIILKMLVALPWRYCSVLSIVANVTSIGVGLCIFH